MSLLLQCFLVYYLLCFTIIDMRIQYEVSDKQYKRIVELVKESGARNRTDYLDHAIRFMEWAIEEIKEGRVIASIKKDEIKGEYSYREVVIPIAKI